MGMVQLLGRDGPCRPQRARWSFGVWEGLGAATELSLGRQRPFAGGVVCSVVEPEVGNMYDLWVELGQKRPLHERP